MRALVRYYAGAAEAAGVEEEHVELPGPVPLSGLLEQLTARRADLGRVLPACSFLLDATRADAGALVGDGAVLDVLPPFAGG
ncbi:MoaD/ThiS family protein [Kineococcus sp. NUM-3379]